jgi:hypothetical protein
MEIVRKEVHMMKKGQGFWIGLYYTNREKFDKLNAVSRLKHKVRRRTRAINWNRVNADRRNLLRRIRYAEKKVKQEKPNQEKT